MFSSLAIRQLKISPASLLKQSKVFSSTMEGFETLSITVPKPFVYQVKLNRPKNLNTMNRKMWFEIGKCFDTLASKDDCRSIVLSAAGKVFSAGIDLKDMVELGGLLAEHDDIARKCKVIEDWLNGYQNDISAVERCPKPVIGAVHNACIGGALDLLTATDVRLCSSDAWFQVKEVDIGMAADVGTLQRLPRIIGNQSLVNEICLTSRKVESQEAKDCGLVSKVYDTKENLLAGAIELAETIASKSPVAVQLTKRSLVHARNHSTQEGLDFIRYWNMTMLQSEDFINAAMAQATKSPPPTFAKL
ncbi:delta(3,5)-Delta(2,4)-dienoyl-CoA isomerase, mitochondrial [Neocloeon triangulifer]|uniref:delta(3,5)-Delta(2,4)-dienoyl-CoA isomerase, mitochondrial n=1 Tax=Neocloeon triangulifer TaxID=2078957 RepID=UPI00286F7253|nr:delta(3,5)-Delta(2,4)-dienoyl-CoA isomerase, mitochondrial [Neocloeon triangulifer]